MNTVLEKMKDNKKTTKIVAFALVSVISISYCFFGGGVTVAYGVEVDGKNVAVVSSKETLVKALDIVSEEVSGNEIGENIVTPKCALTLADKNNIKDEKATATAIIENCDNIVKASQLLVDGEVCACADEKCISDELEKQKNSYNVDGKDCTAEFVENVEVEDGYFIKTALDSAKTVKKIVSNLNVKTVVNVETDVATEYTSTVKKSNEKVLGYRAVTTAGQNGVTRVTEQLVMINGDVAERTELSKEVIIEPVNEVVTVGTAKNSAAAKANETARASGFVFPLPSNVWQVSAYYGDGRNHKGIDLRAPSGTAIYATAAGTVTKAKYDGGFGNCIMIDHGNGLTTLYAHASSMCVKAGQKVNAGDVIGFVGRTGSATGNHLHFSVLAGGNYVNPAPYIGIN